MAASLSLTQLSSGNPVYDKYYRQVDPSGAGHVAATDAALFLKKSGLTDLILGQIWDLADVEQKGCLNKQQFFIALRLVACAQNGLEVTLSSLNVAVPPPKFHDTSSPLLPSGGVSVDGPWVVKPEEKLKFDTIFDSLAPVNGMLSGDKVKPVLLNSKLPVDILGRVWDLSDIDRDGMLDRDEFAVAMYLVYRALEKETVPMSLPPQLVPPSKRKKPVTAAVVPLLPSPPSHKDSRSSHATAKVLASPPVVPQWVVTPTEKAKYDEMFTKTDADMDGLVSGPEVRDIFLKTGLPATTLARIWQLCDMNNMGKLTRDQFALALHLINQKLTKGIEPPQSLLPEMIPPSDRMAVRPTNTMPSQAADFSAIKELDSLSNEIVDLQREKTAVEQEIKEREESIRQRSSEVQDLQDEVQRETGELQRLQAQRQEVQDTLEKLDVQKEALEEQLGQIRQLCSEENELILTLQTQHAEQEEKIGEYEAELERAREELRRLQDEAALMERKVESARARLSPLQDSVKDSYSEVSQAQQKLSELQEEESSTMAQISWRKHLQEEPVLVNGASAVELERQSEEEPTELPEQEEPEESSSSRSPEEQEPKSDTPEGFYNNSAAWPHLSMESCNSSTLVEMTSDITKEEESPNDGALKLDSPEPEKNLEPPQPPTQEMTQEDAPPASTGLDFFQADPFTDHDPFKDDPFARVDVSDPFGGDPFKGTDPFAADAFFKQPSADPFTSSDPFGGVHGSSEPSLFDSQPNGKAVADPFGSQANDMSDADPFSSHVVHAGLDPFTASPSSHELPMKDLPASMNDPFAPGGTAVNVEADSDPFAAAFGSDTFTGGFADFSALSKSNGDDPFRSSSTSSNKNLFKDESQPSSPEVPPALPPKIGTPTRPPPPPPGKRSTISRSESSDSFQRRVPFVAHSSVDFSSLPGKVSQDPFAESLPAHPPRDPERFASFDKYPTEEDMIEWAKRESEREEKERLARLTRQEQEDLELAIALSKSEFS
ncbi:epidermal growth factor receptor substrate 15 isoform X2 [Brienomyrus brachyistius]|uniref:epidermal growth factor receptor substrate 15 isoform X2 n=1 Tax=Brienomyrus brachyistius TaxID=42636 RepID=UPI0020B2CF74|nr:epidermal growth factor receptor substrate 15 isoform X2 [Brienomyrus brachyistius]